MTVGIDQIHTLREILFGALGNVKWLRVIINMDGTDKEFNMPEPLWEEIKKYEPDLVMVDNCGFVYGVKMKLLMTGSEYETESK